MVYPLHRQFSTNELPFSVCNLKVKYLADWFWENTFITNTIKRQITVVLSFNFDIRVSLPLPESLDFSTEDFSAFFWGVMEDRRLVISY
jgi:hypothetical protein